MKRRKGKEGADWEFPKIHSSEERKEVNELGNKERKRRRKGGGRFWSHMGEGNQ